jgi:hypothetical protein
VKTVYTAIVTSLIHSELELSRHLYPLIKAGLLLVKSAVDGSVQSGVNSCDDITATQIIAVNYAFTSKRSRVKVSLNCLLLLQLPTYTVATTVDTNTAATINSDNNGGFTTAVLSKVQQIVAIHSCIDHHALLCCASPWL